MTTFQDVVDNAKKELEQFKANAKEIEERHAYMCDFFMIDKGDEMRDKSEDFFKIWQGFFKQME